MTPRSARELATSVLAYFDLYQQCAQRHNDLQAIWHWQDCWKLVFRNFFGSHKVKHPSPLVYVPDTVVATPLVRPRWFVEKYSRPARKVMSQIAERVKVANHREYFSTRFDVLACGHKIASHVREAGAPPQRWRYCKECPAKNQQMREAGIAGAEREGESPMTVKAFAVAGSANPISGARRVSRRAA
jgi:hypothetical protein